MVDEPELKYRRLTKLFIKVRFAIYIINIGFYLLIKDKLAVWGLVASIILLLSISLITDRYFNIKRVLASTYELLFILLGFILISLTEINPMPISVYIIMIISILSQIFIPVLLFDFKSEKKFIFPILLFYLLAFLFVDDLIHNTTGPNYIELIHETLSLFQWKITILIPFLGFITILILFINKINTNEQLILHYNKMLEEKNNTINEQNKELNETLIHLKETQSQLLQTEKMASLGTLTAGVAHEINNPLNYLMGAYLGLTNYFEEHGSSEKENTELLLNSINVGVDRISGIVKGLSQFSRNNDSMEEDCDIHSILDNCFAMFQNKIKHKAVVLKDYSIEKIVTKGNVGKMHQVFLNVLNNSIQAIPEKGKILAKTRIEGENAIIEILDNGIGIEKKFLKQIIDPFYTTKPPGEGTGLGLSITYSIIKEHKGTLEFESEPNKGTKVIISLPL